MAAASHVSIKHMADSFLSCCLPAVMLLRHFNTCMTQVLLSQPLGEQEPMIILRRLCSHTANTGFLFCRIMVQLQASAMQCC